MSVRWCLTDWSSQRPRPRGAPSVALRRGLPLALDIMGNAVVVGLLLWISTAGAADYVDDLGHGQRYRLYFPPFERVETGTGSGRVTALKVTIHCGYFTSVSPIPGDWWLELHGPVSGESTLAASAGHGASYLWRLETWNGSIGITPYDETCFDVEASVITDGPDDTNVETKYTRDQLKLEP